MAYISNPRLELLSHDHKRQTARVRVSYTALFGAVERAMDGLRYYEQISLRGADDNPDDHLYHFSGRTFTVDPDGTVTRSREVTLSDNILDEDDAFWPFTDGTDEVYARIILTPMMPTGHTRNTNEIHHKF